MPDHEGSKLPEPTAGPLDAPADYPFPKGVEGLLDWKAFDERLRVARNYWLATVRPDGRPHVAPLWGVWIDQMLYFDGSQATRWARNLAANPSATVNLDDSQQAVILEGVVDLFVADDGLGARILEEWDQKYGRLAPEPATRGIFRFRPTVARAWSESLTDGTRWRFTGS